jgi:hypothetical protein
MKEWDFLSSVRERVDGVGRRVGGKSEGGIQPVSMMVISSLHYRCGSTAERSRMAGNKH